MDVFGSAASPVVMGHRGVPLRAPENTPESFAAAAHEGATWVELDARRSGDGVVVVHHDPVTIDGVALVERSGRELRELGVWDLATVLDGLPAGLGVDVELKNLPGQPDYDDGQLADMVAAVLAPRSGQRPLAVTSFNPETALRAAAGLSGVPAGLLTVDAFGVPAGAELADELGFDFLCPNAAADGLDATGVAKAHALGLAVLVWTVDDPDHARALAAAGVDALCTNDPAGLLRALGRPTGGG